jgi:biotin carboxyl carrier protein
VKYQATLAKESHDIEVKDRGDGLYEVVLDGEKHVVDALQMDHGAVSVIIDRASYSIEFEDIGDGALNVLVRGQIFPVDLLDERRLRMRAASGRFAVEGPQTINAPMPGKVVKILCKVGDEVKEGQGLVVVEAMKMENELASPKDGVIKEITAVENASVESGAKLIVVE